MARFLALFTLFHFNLTFISTGGSLELKYQIWDRFYGISCEGPVFMERVFEKC